MPNYLKYAPRVLPILLFVGISFVFYSSSAESIIRFVGAENAYVLIFTLAFFGGLTTFSGIPYHLVLVTLAAGGLNPFLLGMTTAVAVSLGDCTSYFVGYYGRTLMPARVEAALQRLSGLQERYPRLVPLVIFGYGALVPFSSDLITIPMGFLRYPLWRVMIPLGLGTAIFNMTLAYFATEVYGWLALLGG
ncbi:hypothetical protein A3A38_03715 [Candidatus Kaiserbacteria bacterium RIFCSPLOWO2_01_FULL_53_17]|uniref:DedA family protein n=1 Tax=Candidatus Kaiserbacteria bacterium RIFCSPLOWO2_01_FULL_53_17 TaxID=1798511 RepID=A0A1F6EGG7_9BACT|nr:MAG: hypothetical protein A3A38_03715 [Candidatus Kaiserbacteria bacterium RIFCSPLOWO2_01_FULL_53_17]